MPSQKVRVKILAGNKHYTVVEYKGKQYEVDNYLLTNHIRQSTTDGFINYAWVNPVNLQKEWRQ
jgi:hypothetical protein